MNFDPPPQIYDERYSLHCSMNEHITRSLEFLDGTEANLSHSVSLTLRQLKLRLAIAEIEMTDLVMSSLFEWGTGMRKRDANLTLIFPCQEITKTYLWIYTFDLLSCCFGGSKIFINVYSRIHSSKHNKLPDKQRITQLKCNNVIGGYADFELVWLAELGRILVFFSKEAGTQFNLLYTY